MTKTICPCCSKKDYADCCKPYHEGKTPENALKLMRSRYSAYVLNLPEYIVETTHKTSKEYSDNKFSWKKGISKFSQSFIFHKLEVLDSKEKNNFATVTFTVYLSQEGVDATFTERSLFEKIEGKWMYAFGVLSSGRDLNLIIHEELDILPIAYYGEAILTTPANPVDHITPEIKNLVSKMVKTMDIQDGAGIAAPQVHSPLRIFVIRAPLKANQKYFEPNEVRVFINPQLSEFSEEFCKLQEGCLSIPTLEASIERPKQVTIEYMDLDGNIIKRRVLGREARVIMHEYDHLEGILYTDRLTHEDQLKLAPKLKNLQKRIHGI